MIKYFLVFTVQNVQARPVNLPVVLAFHDKKAGKEKNAHKAIQYAPGWPLPF